MKTFEATVSVFINASPGKVWETLTDPESIKHFMYGADIDTDWKEGSKIVYTGEYEGKTYEEKGEILKAVPGKELKTTNFSSISQEEDKPENYATVHYQLEEKNGGTEFSVTQGNIKSEDGIAISRASWEGVLELFKRTVEG